MPPIFNRSMSVNSSPRMDKILYRSMYVDSSPDLDKISAYDPHFSKKWLCQVIMGIFFEIDIFVLKYVLDHSESIPTKNFFDQKFLSLLFFRPKKAKNRGFCRFLVEFFFKFLYPLLKLFIAVLSSHHTHVYI